LTFQQAQAVLLQAPSIQLVAPPWLGGWLPG
jgi:hypothetical protein